MLGINDPRAAFSDVIYFVYGWATAANTLLKSVNKITVSITHKYIYRLSCILLGFRL